MLLVNACRMHAKSNRSELSTTASCIGNTRLMSFKSVCTHLLRLIGLIPRYLKSCDTQFIREDISCELRDINCRWWREHRLWRQWEGLSESARQSTGLLLCLHLIHGGSVILLKLSGRGQPGITR